MESLKEYEKSYVEWLNSLLTIRAGFGIPESLCRELANVIWEKISPVCSYMLYLKENQIPDNHLAVPRKEYEDLKSRCEQLVRMNTKLMQQLTSIGGTNDSRSN